MLDSQIVMNLFTKVPVGVDLMNHNHSPVCVYRGAAAITLANKTIGQIATNRTTPKAISSDKELG
jgi:hypothetical protein